MSSYGMSRPLIPVTFSSLAGIACGLFFQLQPLNIFIWGGILIGLIVILRTVCYAPYLHTICINTMVYLLIFFLSIVKAEVVLQELQPSIHFHDNQVVNVNLEIVNQPKPAKRSPWMEVSVNILRGHPEPAVLVFQSLNTQRTLLAGDHIHGLVKVKTIKIDSTSTKNRFDIWNNIHAIKQPHYLLTFTQQHSYGQITQTSNEHTYRQQILQLIYNKLRHVIPESDTEFIAGLVFGDTSGMSKDVTFAYTILGISHILAVSGMNIELLIRPVLWMFRFFRMPYRSACCATCLVVSCFGWLADSGPSVLRAVIAGNVWLIGTMLNREPDAITTLAFSCIVCLWIDPLNLADVGFQFSFLATLFLILFSGFFQRLFRKIPFSKVVGFDVFCAATVATLPIQMYVFQQWSPYSIAANLLFEPLIPIVMLLVLYLIGCAFLVFPVAVAIGWIVDKIFWLLSVLPVWIVRQKGVYLIQMQPPEAIWCFIIYVFAAMLLLAWDKKA